MTPPTPRTWSDLEWLLTATEEEIANALIAVMDTGPIDVLLDTPGRPRELDARDLVRGMLVAVLKKDKPVSRATAKAIAESAGGEHTQRYLPYPEGTAHSDEDARMRNNAATRVRRLQATLFDNLDGFVGPRGYQLTRQMAVETRLDMAKALFPKVTTIQRDALVAARETGARRYAAEAFQPIVNASLALVPLSARPLLSVLSLDGTFVAGYTNGSKYRVSLETLSNRVIDLAVRIINGRPGPRMKPGEMTLEDAHGIVLEDLASATPHEDNPYLPKSLMCTDANAGPYWRSDSKKQPEYKGYGYEAHIVATAGRSETGTTVPRLALGFALDTPGFRPVENGIAALTAVMTRARDLGIDYHWLAVDRLYNDKVDFWWGAQGLGLALLVDLEDGQLGWAGPELDGLRPCEGALYCAAMPVHLVNATLDFRAGRINERLYGRLIKAREKYLAKANGRIDLSDPANRIRFFCPAQYPGNTVGCKRCGIAAQIMINPGPLPPGARKPAACRQTSITLFAKEILGYQALPFGTEAWEAMEDYFRNAAEGLFATLKKHKSLAIGEGGWAKYLHLPGIALCLAVALAVHNVEAIRQFLLESKKSKDQQVERRRAVRRARPGEGGPRKRRTPRKKLTPRAFGRAASARARAGGVGRGRKVRRGRQP